MFYPEDVRNMSMEELLAAQAAIEQELKRCSNIERDKHIAAICEHMNALRNYKARLCVETSCPECGEEDYVDVLEFFCSGRKMSPADFEVW